MDGFPSGQRGQTVNLLAPPSKVRILLHPLLRSKFKETVLACMLLVFNRKQSCRSGGTGRRTGLKILRDLYSRTGSIPVCGSKDEKGNVEKSAFSFFILAFQT